MQRFQKAILKVNSLEYISEEGSSKVLPLHRDVVKALTFASKKGRFSIKSYENILGKKMPTEYNGQIKKISFKGKRKLTRAELENLPFEPDDKFTVEEVNYSFKQWQEECRPMRVMLSRQEDYDAFWRW